jgi:PAS domain S-box-containing protein
MIRDFYFGRWLNGGSMNTFPRWWKLILALAVIDLLGGTLWYYRAQRQRATQEINATLESIVQLQISWIQEWRSSRLKEGATMMSSRYYTLLAARWMDSPPTAEEVDGVLNGFRLAKREYQFHDALFVSATGKIYFDLTAGPGALHEESRKALEKAFQMKKSTLTDLYLSPDASHPQIDIVAPFFSGESASVPSGAIIYQFDARDFLYSMIRWPIPTRTAETLIVRREGDSVLFLNELRHKKSSAITYRLPLSAKDAPAVRAALGERGSIQGRDYRGAKVLSVVQPIPNSSWFIVAKEDEEEAFSELRREFFFILIALLFLVLSMSAAMVVLWQRNAKAHYRARFEAEALRRKSEERYRNTLDGITEGCQIIDFEWRHIFVNAIAVKHSNHTKEEMLNYPLMEIFPGVEKSDVFAAFRRCMEERTPQHIETALEQPIGQKKWYAISVQPLPEGIFVLTTDITERKQAEAENELLASAIAQCGEVVAIIDTNKIVRYENPAFEAVSGFTREEAIGKPLPINKSQNVAFYRQFWETLESGKTWRGRITNCKKDGTWYTEDATISPVFNSSGTIISYVSVTRDITEYLRLQSEKEKLQEQFLQAQKMESVGRLAGGIAHDFNNMLSVISGHAQLALDALDPAHPLYHNLQEIQKAALHSADLTRQLLAFARKQTIAPKALNLNSVVVQSLSMLQRLIGEDIDLAWMPGHNLWSVHVDPTQINQIMTNLAVNARDAIEKHGKVTIETENISFDESYCAVHQGFVSGKYVMLAFSDDGRGMEKDILDRLFEPFFTTKKSGEGTGLGLATVYGIVKQNDSFINIYSEPGKGSTFKIYFPRYGDMDIAETTEAKAESSRGGTETIMIVEDEPAVLSLTRTMLERLGYTVIAAKMPSEAIFLAQKHAGEIHLLLVDVVMPEMTGRELSERLSELRPKLNKLFMSGYTANVIAHRGVLDEGICFIQKPFSSKELAAKVREALERS